MSDSIGTRSMPRVPRARAHAERTFGPWRVVRELGAGQWSRVFQARHESTDESDSADYVIKALRPEYEQDPVAIGMLQREALVADQVRHVHLASVLAHRLQSAPYYLIAAYVPGNTALELFGSHGPLAAPHSLWIVRQSAEALRAMHSEGWRHGDVKPANIFVAENGHTTLLDLGFADRIETTSRARRSMITASLAYAAPETFHGSPQLGAYSDIYSLGVTLFELLTGQRPFTSEDTESLAISHLQELPPDPRKLVPQLSPSICRLVKRMLAKEPLRRPGGDELIDRMVDLEIETFDERGVA